MKPNSPSPCPGVTRRSFLLDTGMGFTGLALSAMLFRDGIASASPVNAWRPPDGQPHFAPRAKSVIWIFLCGGVSHLESFDVKPELNKYAGKSIAETPYKGVLATEGKDIVGGNPNHGNRKVIMPLIAATEKRMDLDHSISKRLELLLAKANEPRPAATRSSKKTEG